MVGKDFGILACLFVCGFSLFSPKTYTSGGMMGMSLRFGVLNKTGNFRAFESYTVLSPEVKVLSICYKRLFTIILT